MERFSVTSRVDGNGILDLSLHVGAANANQEVQVTIEPVVLHSMSPDEWRQQILATAGKWQGDLERPAQGDYEQREPLS